MPRVSRSKSVRKSRSESADTKYRSRTNRKYRHHFKGYVATAQIKYCKFGESKSRSRSSRDSSYSPRRKFSSSHWKRNYSKKEKRYHSRHSSHYYDKYRNKKRYERRSNDRRMNTSPNEKKFRNHGYIYEGRKENVWFQTG